MRGEQVEVENKWINSGYYTLPNNNERVTTIASVQQPLRVKVYQRWEERVLHYCDAFITKGIPLESRELYPNCKSCMDLFQEFPVSLAPINDSNFSFKNCPQWSSLIGWQIFIQHGSLAGLYHTSLEKRSCVLSVSVQRQAWNATSCVHVWDSS